MQSLVTPVIRAPVQVFCATLLLTGLLFAAGANGPFLFDDFANIVDNGRLIGAVKSPLDLRASALSSESSLLHRPLTTLTFALQAPEKGLEWSASALKITNVFIHLLCSVCVFWFATLLVKAPMWVPSKSVRSWWPVLAASIWALNPSHVSTVLYSVQRMAQLSTLFVLLGLCAFVFWRLRLAVSEFDLDSSLAALGWVALCLGLGVMAKENAILLPWLIVITEFAFFRGRLGGTDHRGLRSAGIVAFAAPLVLFVLCTYFYLDWIVAGYDIRPFNLTERILTQARVLWSYASWFCFPRVNEFGLFHDDFVISTDFMTPLSTSIAVVAWPCVLIGGLLAQKRSPLLVFVPFYFLAAHSIESTVLALEMVFEHRNYLPSVALALGLAAILLKLFDACARFGTSPMLSASPTIALLVALTLATFVRASSWGDELSMARTQVERHPDSERNGYLYANALIDAALETSGDAKQEYFALARHEFELLAQKHPWSLPIQVMLYITDVKLYPQFDQADDRFNALERTARDLTEVSATDVAALGALVNCYVEPDCLVDGARLRALLSTVRERDRRPKAIEQLELEVLRNKSKNVVVVTRYSEALREAAHRYPTDISIAYQLISDRIGRKDFAAAHEAVINLMRLDRWRRQLPAMRDTFAVNKPVR